MSYELISESRPKARKEYKCIWCGQNILKGETHYYEISKYEGGFQDHRWHTECFKFFLERFDTYDDGEYKPYLNERPDKERAGL